jgi:hypothetical protein
VDLPTLFAGGKLDPVDQASEHIGGLGAGVGRIQGLGQIGDLAGVAVHKIGWDRLRVVGGRLGKALGQRICLGFEVFEARHQGSAVAAVFDG